MNAKIQAECQIVIDNTTKIDEINHYIFRLERIGNTSPKFRVHINRLGLLYQMIIGTNDENTSKQELASEILTIEKIAKILDKEIDCHINILHIIGKFKDEKRKE